MSRFETTSPLDRLPRAVKTLLIANVGVFFLQILSGGRLFEYLALTPVTVWQQGQVWQLVTYSFVHANGWHLFMNMFALWMFGPHMELQWGTRAFLVYYAVCVFGAALLQSAVAPFATVAGASGGIYGLLIAFGLLFPDSVILLFFVFPMRALQAVIFIALITLVSAVGSGGSRVAHIAHLGGMAAGFLYLKIPLFFQSLKNRDWFRYRKRPRLTVITPDDTDLTREVDRILEKISSSGLDSLTPQEHDTMRRYAKRKL